jgi:hypothetical protein
MNHSIGICLQSSKYLFTLLLFLSILTYLTLLPIAPQAYACESPESIVKGKSQTERVVLLSKRASEYFQNGDEACSSSILEKASAEIKAMESGQERTIAGYEIKETVFNTIEKKNLTGDDILKKSVLLSLQSLESGSDVSRQATRAEKIADGAFILRVIRKLNEDTENEKSGVDLFLVMLRIGETLKNQDKPYTNFEITSYFINNLLRYSVFDDMIKAFNEIQDNETKSSVIFALKNNLHSTLGEAAENLQEKTQKDKDAVLHKADEAEQLIRFIETESEAGKNLPKTTPAMVQRPEPAPIWRVNLRRFIWESYYLAGRTDDAKKKLDLWIMSCRGLINNIQQVRALKDISKDIHSYKANAYDGLALSLLDEAEQKALLVEDPGFRKLEIEDITRVRNFFK